MHTHIHTHTHTRTHIHICQRRVEYDKVAPCDQSCTHSHTHIHTYTHTHIHTYTHRHTHTNTKALTDTRTHTHTHTHISQWLVEYDKVAPFDEGGLGGALVCISPEFVAWEPFQKFAGKGIYPQKSSYFHYTARCYKNSIQQQ